MGALNFDLAGQKVNCLGGHFRLDRRFVLPARQQLVHRTRIQQRAAQRVLAKLARLFQNVDVFFRERGVGMRCVVLHR